MASLPPRRSHNISGSSCAPGHRSHLTLSPLQTLLQMGCPKTRAEKALAATGYRGAQLAADWLLAHVNDPTLDVNHPREYTLYLCPTGPLADQIHKYRMELRDQTGWNPAHNLIPHFALCSFFQCPDDCVTLLINAFDKIVDKFKAEFPESFSLHLNMSKSHCALHMAEEHKNLLKRFSLSFMKEISQFLGTESNPLHVIGTCFPWWSHFPSLSTSGHQRRGQMQLDPHGKSLHLTLAHLNEGRDNSIAQKLANMIELDGPASECIWELRLYSRDHRIRSHEVYKIIYGHSPQQADELELLIGDFVYVSPDSLASTPDGWVQGVSWLTGNSGYLPTNYIERTSESDAWTIHRCSPIIALNGLGNLPTSDDIAIRSSNGSDADLIAGNDLNAGIGNGLNNETANKRGRFTSTCLGVGRDRSTSSDPLLPNSEANINEQADTSTSASSSNNKTPKLQSSKSNRSSDHSKRSSKSNEAVSSKNGDQVDDTMATQDTMAIPPKIDTKVRSRRIFVLRHAERMDFTFGRDWYKICFNDKGEYKRVDINQPDVVPPRKAANEWDKDAPLTKMGLFQAALTGQALANAGIRFSSVFCSPSYRCIQTCHEVLAQLGIAGNVPLNIEPGLFEWLAWYADGLPLFLNPDALRTLGFNISSSYTPIITNEELNARGTESVSKYYARSHLLVTSLLERFTEGGDLLFVGHSATLDALTCQLIGQEPRHDHSMIKIVRQIPYCGLVVGQEQSRVASSSTSNVKSSRKWSLVPSPILTLSHSGNQSFDPVKLLSTSQLQLSSSSSQQTNSSSQQTANGKNVTNKPNESQASTQNGSTKSESNQPTKTAIV